MNFQGASCRGTIFRGANLTGSSFEDADITGADFSGANLTRCSFIGAKGIMQAKWGGAILKDTRFSPGINTRRLPQ